MTHTPLIMNGHKTVNGVASMGVFTADEIKAWIIDKLGLDTTGVITRGSNISMVVSDFSSGRGKATSGPSKHVPHAGFMQPNTAHTSMYRGSHILHASAGSAGKGNGVTIFYVNAQGNDGKIIGIGHHVNSSTYGIEWSVSDWHVGHSVVLS